MDKTLEVNKRRERMARYRKAHPRIDYMPSAEALAVIEEFRHLDRPIVGVVDRLIVVGGAALTGELELAEVLERLGDGEAELSE